jgi:hypothetical protein
VFGCRVRVVVLGLSPCSGCRARVVVLGLSCSVSSLPPFLSSFPSSQPQNPTNLSPQSIDRITWRARSRSSWQQESITGQEDARRQSAFDLTISEKSGLRGASSTQDGVEKFGARVGVSDLSRSPGAHRRQKVARASLAKRSEDK